MRVGNSTHCNYHTCIKPPSGVGPGAWGTHKGEWERCCASTGAPLDTLSCFQWGSSWMILGSFTGVSVSPFGSTLPPSLIIAIVCFWQCGTTGEWFRVQDKHQQELPDTAIILRRYLLVIQFVLTVSIIKIPTINTTCAITCCKTSNKTTRKPHFWHHKNFLAQYPVLATLDW